MTRPKHTPGDLKGLIELGWFDPLRFYYVLEEVTGRYIVRAAQTRLRDAMDYTDGSESRFIVGPVTAEQLHSLFPSTL